jgi:hypothetical protein
VDYQIEINSIGRIKFLMEYDVMKTSSENILVEQPKPNDFFRRFTYNQELAKIAGYKNVTPKQADELAAAGRLIYAAQTAGLKDMISTDPESALRKAMILDPYRDKGKDGTIDLPSTHVNRMYRSTSTAEQFSKLWTNWDHETSGNVELTLTLLGMGLVASGIGAPVGLAMIGAGTAIGITDAIKYYDEGDPYSGTMMMALQLIPGGELIRGLSKYSPKFASKLPQFQIVLKKLADNKMLTDVEEKLYEEGSKAFNYYLPQLSRAMSKAAIRLLKIKLKKLPLGSLLVLFIKTFQKVKGGLSFLTKLIVKLLRISITIDQLWTLMQTPESVRMKIRDESSFGQMLDSFYGFSSDVEKKGLWKVYQQLWNSDGTPNFEGQEEIRDGLVDVSTDSMTVQYYEKLESVSISDDLDPNSFEVTKLNHWKEKRIEVLDTPSIESILSGKQTIQKGQKSNVVKEIQKMLLHLGYDLGKFGEKKAGLDGDFGETTKNAVIEFQTDNNLKNKSGVVDKETLSLLKKQFK